MGLENVLQAEMSASVSSARGTADMMTFGGPRGAKKGHVGDQPPQALRHLRDHPLLTSKWSKLTDCGAPREVKNRHPIDTTIILGSGGGLVAGGPGDGQVRPKELLIHVFYLVLWPSMPDPGAIIPYGNRLCRPQAHGVQHWAGAQ